MVFKTHFEVEKLSTVRANRGTRGSLKQPFYILHKTPVSGKIRKIIENIKIKKLAAPPSQTPDITTPIRTIPTRNTPQNPVNQQHSNQQVEQSEQENIFTAIYQSTFESFVINLVDFLCCNF